MLCTPRCTNDLKDYDPDGRPIIVSIEISDHPPRTRCYKCGSTHVEAVCHHCHRAMCSSHISSVVDAQENLLSAEFTDLGLKQTCGEIPFHCEFCYHIVPLYDATLIIYGIVIILVALLLSFDTPVRFINGLIGIGIIWLGISINKINAKEAMKSRPPLPLLPQFSTIAIQETLRARIDLDPKGAYSDPIRAANGKLDVAASFGKAEQDQLEQYRKKYRLSENQNIPFSAGFVALQSRAGIDFFNIPPGNRHTILALTDIDVKHYETQEWRIPRKYDLTKTITSFPVRIVPSLIQATDRRALDLEIQWVGPSIDTNKIVIDKIDLLKLSVPARWGQIDHAGGGMVEHGTLVRGDPVNTIKWSNLLITDGERRKRQRIFSISFENAVKENDSIQGKLEVIFKGALSGIEGIDLFNPLGGRWRGNAGDISTKLIIDFELSLANLRYQDFRVVPDLNVEGDKDKLEPLVFKGLIPDHNTVIKLTNAISENDYYIKRIIENPPRTGEQANRVNRYWDIAGREYDGVYPIDFHLVVSGETIKREEFRTPLGITKVSLTVRGIYANENMKDKIEASWERLCHLICTTLEELLRAKASQIDGKTERITFMKKQLDDAFELLKVGRLSEAAFLKIRSEIEKVLESL
ncbi:MAG TPA: hypothetical protein VK249_21395 [Anaerolineales bacterium]|nr:hypothetical protein [Anaerolineales bacterium]